MFERFKNNMLRGKYKRYMWKGIFIGYLLHCSHEPDRKKNKASVRLLPTVEKHTSKSGNNAGVVHECTLIGRWRREEKDVEWHSPEGAMVEPKAGPCITAAKQEVILPPKGDETAVVPTVEGTQFAPKQEERPERLRTPCTCTE